MRVLLGPSHELHDGIHGALTDYPAPGIEYVERAYSTRFRHEARQLFSPIHDHSECEWIRFDDETGVDVVHSARFPVETSLPWVVDADCLLLPLQFGAFFALGIHGGSRRPDEARIKRREAAMAARYADPGCAKIMLRTERARKQFLDVMGTNGLIDDRTVAVLADKTVVVYPAVAAPRPRSRPAGRLPLILFMGRTFDDKGGAIAIAVFERLRAVLGSAFLATVISNCPPAAERLSSLGIEVRPTMRRADYLGRLAETDIFFSPTLFESFGMGLVEAAAAGAAIVTSSGPGMEHIGELFEDGKNALLVSNALDEASRIRAYADGIVALVRDEPARKRLAANAHALACEGRLSLHRHNRGMGAIYEAALRSRASASATATAGGKPRGHAGASEILVWSERVCHWQKRRHTPPGGLRICL